MAQNRLARIQWQMGQTLLPDHFVAQEDAHLIDTALRFTMMGLPFFGIGRLAWNEGLLTEGILSVQKLTLIFPSGLLVDVPGNAAVSTFNMNTVGRTALPVYLHLLEETEAVAEEVFDDAEPLDRVLYRLVLNSEQSLNSALYSLKLAEFIKDPEGNWQPRDWAIPSLLRVGSSPFLQPAIERLDALLDNFHFKLSRQIADSFLSGESLASAKSCLKAVYRLKAYFANMKQRVFPHPFHLFEALREFYLEVAFYQDSTPKHGTEPYTHDNPGKCFRIMFLAIGALIQQIKSKSPYITFEQKDGKFIVERLPDAVRLAPENYLLIQKPRVGTQFSMEGFKLAAGSRLAVVHQHALQGIPLQKIDRPPFQHPFGPEVEFFRVQPGEEWDLALRDGSVAFFEQPGFNELNAFLYWRQG